MHYELLIQGDPPVRFETEHEVIDAAQKAVRQNRNAQVRVIDLATGRPANFTDRRSSREDYIRALSL